MKKNGQNQELEGSGMNTNASSYAIFITLL